MKKRLFTLCVALMATLRLFAGYDFTFDGVCYTTLGGDSVEVGVNKDATGAIIIPEIVTFGIKTYRVTSIGSSAFSHCTGLTSITIPNSVKTIGAWAFSGCSGLTSINIPNSVTSIEGRDYWGAFQNCTGLTSITIGENVTEIGQSAFEGCTSLTSVVWNAINCADFSFSSPFPTSVTSFTFGEKVEHIPADLCCNMSGLTSVTIPNSVTSIGHGAFSGCTGLTSVSIPNNVTSIGNSAFRDCSSLTSITIPNSVTNIGSSAFNDCSSLTSVTIPDSVTSIEGSTFNGCSGLISITVPNNVTSIGMYAFAGCTSLTSITIPNGVKSIGSWAFEGCISLTSIVIPDSVTSIERATFSRCTGLTSVSIPNSVTKIGQSAFEGCTSLTSVTIGESVTSIELSAFRDCSSLTSITIPNSIRSIGSWAFRDCTSLTYIELLYIYIVIPDDALRGCINLTDIYVPCGGLAWMLQTWNENIRHENRLKYKPLPYTVTTIATNGSVSVPQNICDEMEVTATPDYGYHFVQWSDGDTENPRSIELTKDTVFSAKFAPNIYSFSATCNDNHGSVQATNGNYEYLTELTISATPKNGYHFVHWSDGDKTNPKTFTLTQDTTFTAVFAVNQYTITWKQDDGTTIDQTSVEYGQLPSHESATKAATAEFTYTFAGWTPEIVAVIGEATYTATYTSTRNSYTITWKNDDDGIIDQTSVEYGHIPTHSDPSKLATAEYTYTFAGWTPEVVAVTEDATYTATFTNTRNKYLITFLDEDGTELCAQEWEYGAIPSCVEPTKTDDEQYTYTFAGWTPEVVEVVSETTYTATYTAKSKGEGLDDIYIDDLTPHKVIIDGQILIFRGDKTYTITGAEIK